MAEKGKFIVIEGIDGSGKSLQFELLKQRLNSEGYKLLIADFPRYYESEWGKLVGRFLAGEFGKLDEVNPYLAVLTYMLDQYTWSRDVGVPWAEKGGMILSNRFFTSNVHQIAKLKSRAQKNFRDWLWPMGYEKLGILKPDLVIFIDTKPNVAKKLNLKKGARAYIKKKRRDIAENHWEHQKAAYREYIRTVKKYHWWVSVPGVKNPDVDYSALIHENIWRLVEEKMLK